MFNRLTLPSTALYTFDMAWDVFEEKAQEYDNWFDRHFGAGAFALELKSIKRLEKKIPDDSLEIGVGTGRFARSLGIRFGIDPSQNVLRYAKKRGIQVSRAVAESLPFRASSFSSVFMIVTVCFLDDPHQAFTEVNRILKHGGILVLGLILRDSGWGDFYEHKKASGNVFYSHAHFWNKDELFDILGRTGFAVTDSVSTLFDPPGSLMIINHKIQKGLHSDAGFHSVVAKKV